MVPPPSLAAILAAADRSRWPVNWQARQASTRPAGLGIRDRQAGQVELLWRHRIIDYLLLRATRPG